jgi:hypothetical protein
MSISEKLTQIAENEQRVFDAGKNAEWSAFWDAFQANGTKVNYDNAFAEAGNGLASWVYGTTFRPKHTIKPKTAQGMFAISRLSPEAIALVDFSECTDFYQTFRYFVGTRLPSIDFSKATITSQTFMNLQRTTTIDRILVSESTPFNNTFQNCTTLTTIIFDGVIGQNGLNLQWSPLTEDSLDSIVGALADKSTDTSGTEWIVTLGSDNISKLHSNDLAIIESKGWQVR